MTYDTSEQLCADLARVNDGTAILSFSTGKDSIAAWLHMAQYFDRIYPVYLYLVPGLSFVDESLAYYQDFFKTRIIQLPHPSLYRLLNSFAMQAPENCAVIEEMELPNFDYLDVYQIIREDYNLPAHTPAASGVRARDSLARWISIKKHGPFNATKRTFFPIFDFDKARMVKTLYRSGVKLPVDYRMFGRSFDGIDFRFLGPIKKHYPADYENILAYFPLAELDLKRIEYRQNYFQTLQAKGGAA